MRGRNLIGPRIPVTHEERMRIRGLLERDKAYADAEAARLAARMEIEDGLTVNITDAVDGPTDEWLTKHQTERFTPRLEDGTVRTVSAIRRVVTPICVRIHRAGHLTDDQLAACIWYREQYDESGLDGRIKTVDYGREVFAAPQNRLPFTPRQSEAQANLRAARGSITKRYRQFYDLVVIGDMGVREAAGNCRFDPKRATLRLTDCAQAVQDCRLKLAQ